VSQRGVPGRPSAPTGSALPALQVFLTQTHLAIAMEYAQGGDLFNYTLGHRPHGRLAEQQARWIFQQLIIGLDYCHRRVRPARACLVVSPGMPRLRGGQQALRACSAAYERRRVLTAGRAVLALFAELGNLSTQSHLWFAQTGTRARRGTAVFLPV
jgi:hypothetical protein